MADDEAHGIMSSLCLKILKLESRDDTAWKRDYDSMVHAQDRAEAVHWYRAHIFQAVHTQLRDISSTPCFTYALCHWFEHYNHTAPDAEVDREVASFIQSTEGYYLHMIWSLWQSVVVGPPRPKYLTWYFKAA